MSSARNLYTWQKRDLAFLAGALLVHAAILLIPLRSWQSPAPVVQPRLTIDLQTKLVPRKDRAAPQQEIPEPAEEQVSTATETPPPLPARRSARIALDDLPEQPVPETPPEEATEPDPTTVKQLREWLAESRLEFPSEETGQRLGSAKAYRPPANWNRSAGAPYLAEIDNTFNGMTVPEDVEIVDRWLAADGSQNVVVNLPNGETLCGRAEAWNPAQPLVEHIMMFRTCGGGGKRTFSMPERYHRVQ